MGEEGSSPTLGDSIPPAGRLDGALSNRRFQPGEAGGDVATPKINTPFGTWSEAAVVFPDRRNPARTARRPG